MKQLTIHTLKSSSRGNSEIICGEKTKILVDCGVSGKALESSLSELGISCEELSAIVVTHEHIDHIKGVGILSRKFNIPIYANENTWNAMGGCVGKISEENINIFRTGEEFKIGDITVKAFDIPHDASEPVGYTFGADGISVAVATDMGEVRNNVFDAVCGCSEILIEANYDEAMLDMGTYPYELKRRIKGALGHLCNTDAGDFAAGLVKSGTKRIILGHLSWENNYPGLAFYTVRNILAEKGIDIEKDVELCVAQRDKAGVINSCEI